MSKDVADWISLMSSFSRRNRPRDAILLFALMLENRTEIDDVAMVFLFSSCAWLRDVGVGSQGHGRVLKMGLEGRVKVCNALMDMYGKSGMVTDM
ncbi:hypothetical protein F3Y22_tig00110889pilonHSYRG00109 [Hibiscus syriacus]|uniref:Pentatricopeptide repeat-containing protein n=1 Tax=Hibiscus syriacus TaxID=106335 RepID=A0A6A2ZI42_HIBSY|nr:hypothetical protein F3Y22_tig00110889pilonHSYRG00109 [Hibiscus syriacus]